ncbi:MULTISPECIES: hypothetical protein [unclassified Microbacterium]|uniref:hypothetical protein n=1 Tax=unclassified Microbacterium TaxID=2609290 RepID=UPI002882DC7C|nr:MULTISPECIES: hypothetical protein [unclassified Microbacterium]
MTTTTTTSRVLDPHLEIELADGTIHVGRLEYFPDGKSLTLFDDEVTDPVLLTVPVTEAPIETAALPDDHVLLRNWTEHRGVPEQLASNGLIGLTDEQVAVGMFRLQGLVAKVL